jgi:subtilase family serine protease
MRRPFLSAAGVVAALLTSVALAPSADAAPSHAVHGHRNVAVCTSAPAGYAHCLAVRHDAVDTAGDVVPQATTAAPAGLAPADVQAAYRLPGAAGRTGRTVAIVDAYDAPSAEADLGVYRSRFGLSACTTANGCFKKVSQTGGTNRNSLPRADAGWAQEISLDLDMVSAACPTCKILLVEARSTSFTDLATAVRFAASVPGVVAISNSYGGSDLSNTTIANSYNQPGIAVTASTGDAGYGVESPASFPAVVAVGGTSLVRDTTTGRGWTETAWSGAGSGCSTLNAKPAWQTTATGCTKKATADVSAVADPQTGVAVYDSYAYQGASGWLVFGGTSASSPIVASVYALGSTATGRGGQVNPVSHTWATSDGLFDVTSGTNGTCATGLWCASGVGWDGPTGLGTPNGTSSF